jgi:Pvc16 N-terminal domain
MSTILTTLELIRQKLNEFFKNADPRNEDWVILSNIVDQEGNANEQAKDKVVMFLANIKYETIISTYSATTPAKNNQYALITPTLYIDLFVLFFANFNDKNYPEGLGVISRTISFFQQNPWFTRDNLPGLDSEIDKLTFEMVNLEMTDLNYLMGMIGAKYLPSVFYKVRVIPFRSAAMSGQVSPVHGVEPDGEG